MLHSLHYVNNYLSNDILNSNDFLRGSVDSILLGFFFPVATLFAPHNGTTKCKFITDIGNKIRNSLLTDQTIILNEIFKTKILRNDIHNKVKRYLHI